jgi:enterochelin esterase family protein
MWLPFAPERPDDFAMHRLGRTDLWYKTMRLPAGSRFGYQLSPNDTLTRAPNAQRYATAQADPLNPRRQPMDPNLTKYEVLSEAELPGAAPQPWSDRRAGVAAGSLKNYQVSGRDVTVYTPPGYRKDGPVYPALLLFDGKTYLRDVPAPVILDNLIAEKKIAPMVAVLIEATPDRRGDEFFGNVRYAEFVAKELMPWAAREYHIAAASNQNIIGGLSAGGFAAAFIALQQPTAFGKVLCQSGAFWWSPKVDQGEERNSLARDYASAPRHNLKFFLEAGLFENDVVGVGGQILEHNRHLRDVLRAKGYEVHYQEYPGGHERFNWRGSLADGLLKLAGNP